MSEQVIRPTQSVRQFFAWAADQARKQAIQIELPEGDVQAIRDAVQAKAAGLLRSSVKREIGNAGRLNKSMAKLELKIRKEITKAEAKLERAKRLQQAYRDDPQLEDRRKAAARKVRELTATAGRVGQAAKDWQHWGGQLQRLVPEVESAVERAEPSRPSTPRGHAIIVGGSGYQPTPREPDTGERRL